MALTEIRIRKLPGLVGQILDEVQRTINELVRGVKILNTKQKLLIGKYEGLLADGTTTILQLNGNVRRFIAYRSGSITGITYTLAQAASAGLLDVEITKNGTVVHTGKIDAVAGSKWDNTTYHAQIPPGITQFGRGDGIGLQIVASGGFSPGDFINPTCGFIEIEV